MADRRQVEHGYARVNAMWKTQGAVATLRYVHHLPHGRAIPLGLELSEVDRIIASCDSFYRGGYRDWPTQWFKAGDQYLERGRKALTSSYRETAAQMIFTAAACYHLAGYMHHDIGRLLPETRHSMLRAVELYWEAAPLFSPPSLLIEIPYDGTVLRPFLRLPHGVEASALRRADWRRELEHDQYARGRRILPRSRHGDDRSRRPGAGRVLRAHRAPLRVDAYDRALGAVADWAAKDSRIDGTRIGIYGRATGSLLAMHAAAKDKRFKAIVAHPGAFAVANYFQQAFAHTLVSHRLEMCSFLGGKTLEEGERLCREELTLEHVADDVDLPILTVCSADDETMPTTESTILKERVKGPVEIVTFPGKGHGGPSRLSLPLEADWMGDRLQ